MESGRNPRDIHANAIVLAIGFKTQQMLFPMEIRDEKGISLNDRVRKPS